MFTTKFIGTDVSSVQSYRINVVECPPLKPVPDILVNFPFYAKVLNVMLSSTKEVGGEGVGGTP